MRVLISTLIASLLVFSGTGYCETQEEVVIQTLLLEARGEGLIGMQAVGEVIRNRASSKNKSYEEVVLTPFQFSCWGEPINKVNRKLSKFTEYDWQLASKAWALSEDSRLTNGANHYLAKKSLKHLPSWAKEWLITAKLGNHTFYRL